MDDLVNYDHVVLPSGEHRVKDPRAIRLFEDLEEHGDFDLTEVERLWTKDYDYLLLRGYQLRPRFHPSWTPSWRGTGLAPTACKDSIEHFIPSVIDAKRLEDGKIVAIKRIPPFTLEAQVALMLSTPEHLQNPMNHCVPVYDHFSDSRDPRGASFIVMPLLRPFNDPPFTYVDEIVDFIRQTLEGLVYIHNQNVAHRDLSDGNIMMDGRQLYGNRGFHPSDQDVTASDITVLAKPKTRKDVGLVKYYFTDFGLSTHFEDPLAERLVVGNRAQEREVPELSSVIPYDPFAVDIFTLGMVFRRNLLEKYSNVDFLSPLCSAMTQQVSRKRPTATDALAMFQQSLSGRRGVALRWHLHERRETRLKRFVVNFHSAFKELVYQVKSPIAFVFLMLRALILFPLKFFSFLLYYGPRRAIAYLRRWVDRPEHRPLLSGG